MISPKLTSHRLSPLSGQPGTLERTGLVEGDASAVEVVVAYHERTKHHFYRYAAALEESAAVLQIDAQSHSTQQGPHDH